MEGVEVSPSGAVCFTGSGVQVFRWMTLRRGLKMELRGMRMTLKTPTCYSIIKREWGFKGNKQKVLDQFESFLTDQGLPLHP